MNGKNKKIYINIINGDDTVTTAYVTEKELEKLKAEGKEVRYGVKNY